MLIILVISVAQAQFTQTTQSAAIFNGWITMVVASISTVKAALKRKPNLKWRHKQQQILNRQQSKLNVK